MRKPKNIHSEQPPKTLRSAACFCAKLFSTNRQTSNNAIIGSNNLQRGFIVLFLFCVNRLRAAIINRKLLAYPKRRCRYFFGQLFVHHFLLMDKFDFNRPRSDLVTQRRQSFRVFGLEFRRVELLNLQCNHLQEGARSSS